MRTAVEWLKLGVALHREGDFAGALRAHDKAAQLDPWLAEADYRKIAPFDALLRWDDPSKHRQCADIGVSNLTCGAPWPVKPIQGRRIRLAYVSSDPKEHAVRRLLAGIIPHHDASKFELVESDPDIAIDLMGHTRSHSLARFAQRIAPVQVSWLGYPGTTGLPSMDYLIADPFIASDAMKATVSEKLILMPDCYVCSSREPIGSSTRARHGLPETAFVFANFCQGIRITPDAVRTWQVLLRRVPDSVLWLLDSPQARTIQSDRIILARRLPHAEHMARLALADLYLDTFPYGSHTTASDVLWAGRPIVTIAGRGFPSRVCGSLLNTIGVPELISGDWHEYAAIALRLAKNPDQLASVTERVRAGKASPLFDGERFCRNLEAAFERMLTS